MTQEDKDLLLKYLCMALPYKVIIEYNNDSCVEKREMGLGSLHDFMFDNAEVKPYLRPISSMTEEEKEEVYHDCYVVSIDFERRATDMIAVPNAIKVVNWLLKNHFDIYGLIEKGLAIEVTKENNPYKE
jgi:hypothetical protein